VRAGKLWQMPPVDPDFQHVHGEVGMRLARISQRYTSGRRELVDTLLRAEGPLSLPQLLELTPETPQSSAYRHLAVLSQAGVVQKLSSNDEFGRFELSEALTGHHHHHLSCTSCGTVSDVEMPASFEHAFSAAAAELSSTTGFSISTHDIVFGGICSQCRAQS
jgi:Fur family transcriptional regulator, ferric uptake regulator